MPTNKRDANRLVTVDLADPAYHADRPAFSPKEMAFASQLPTFKVGEVYMTPVGDDPAPVRVAELTCVRSDCGGMFIVPVALYWRKDRHLSGGCPFCFKTSRRGKRPKGSRSA